MTFCWNLDMHDTADTFPRLFSFFWFTMCVRLAEYVRNYSIWCFKHYFCTHEESTFGKMSNMMFVSPQIIVIGHYTENISFNLYCNQKNRTEQNNE